MRSPLLALLVASGCLSPVGEVEVRPQFAPEPPSVEAPSEQPVEQPVEQTLERACSQVTVAWTSRRVRCGAETSSASPAAAIELQTQGCIASARATGAVVPNGAALATCLDDLAASCSLETTRCDASDLFSGTLGAGENCFGPFACRSELFCDNTRSCPAKCAARLAEGTRVTVDNGVSPCVRSASPRQGVCTALVAEGDWCAPKDGSMLPLPCVEPARCSGGICTRVALPGEGASCTQTCAVGLVCRSGLCERLRHAGEACGPEACQSGLECSMGVCVPLVPAPLGGRCGQLNPCSEGFCSFGICTAFPELGGACTPLTGCGSGLQCGSSGRCEEPGRLGVECAFRGCQPGLYCGSPTFGHAAVCLTKLPNGSPCTFGEECEGACLGGRCTSLYCRAP